MTSKFSYGEQWNGSCSRKSRESQVFYTRQYFWRSLTSCDFMNSTHFRLPLLLFVATAVVILGYVGGYQGCELPDFIQTFPELTQDAYRVLFHVPLCNGAWQFFAPMFLAALLYRTLEPMLWTAAGCGLFELLVRYVADDSIWWLWMPVWKAAASASYGAAAYLCIAVLVRKRSKSSVETGNGD